MKRMSRVGPKGPRKQNVEARRALGRAMLEIYSALGKRQKAVEKAIGLAQSSVSDVMENRNMTRPPLRGVEIEVLINMRAVLGRSIDDILELPAIAAQREGPDGTGTSIEAAREMHARATGQTDDSSVMRTRPKKRLVKRDRSGVRKE